MDYDELTNKIRKYEKLLAEDEMPHILFPKVIVDNILKIPRNSLHIWIYLAATGDKDSWKGFHFCNEIMEWLCLSHEELTEEMQILHDLGFITMDHKNQTITINSGLNLNI